MVVVALVAFVLTIVRVIPVIIADTNFLVLVFVFTVTLPITGTLALWIFYLRDRDVDRKHLKCFVFFVCLFLISIPFNWSFIWYIFGRAFTP